MTAVLLFYRNFTNIQTQQWWLKSTKTKNKKKRGLHLFPCLEPFPLAFQCAFWVGHWGLQLPFLSIEINGMGLLLHSYIHIYICMHIYERHYIEKQPNRNQIKLVLKILREQGSFFFFFSCSVSYLTFPWLNQIQVWRANIQAWMMERERERERAGKVRRGS